mgnify:CR=1 FL=1
MIFRIMLPWAMAGSMVFGQDFRLASLFTDHGVLQRETPVPIWGWAKPGQKVVVRFAGQVSEATAKADGSWRVDLKPLAINREGTDLVVVAGSESKTLKNVVVGDVWLCGGQSNMEWPVAQLMTFALALAADFDRVLSAWRDWHSEGVRLDVGFLGDAARASVASELAEEDAYAVDGPAQAPGLLELRDAMSLVWRVLLLWLGVLALFVLAGWST